MKKTYEILSKIEKNKLDQEASKLGKLKQELSILQNELKKNQDKMIKESNNYGNDTLVYLGSFIKNMRHINQNLEKMIKVKKIEVEKQEEVVKNFFIEKKKFDILYENVQKDEKIKAETEENKELDEIAKNVWIK
jgi:flagellar biosynthesis chaperone FliJ